MTPRVLAIGTAVPEYRVDRQQARTFARHVFEGRLTGLDRLLGVFDRTSVEERQVVRPPEWFAQPRSFAEKNAVYGEAARELSRRSAAAALASGPVEPWEIRSLVFVSSTGIATPSLDARLVQDLGLAPDVARVPLWGLGCGGGAAGLARAAALARGGLGPVLLVATEICSTTFVHDDVSKANLIAASLFGDGSAAAVIGDGKAGPELLGAHAHLFPDSESVMGWDVVEAGLKVRFATDIPRIVRASMAEIADAAAHRAGLRRPDLQHWVVHPGGDRVLHAYRESLGLTDTQLDAAWEVLHDHGNLSSPTVLFVLERFLATTHPTEAPGLLLGLGPGFGAEAVVFRW